MKTLRWLNGRYTGVAGVAALMVVFLHTAWIGLNFGEHYDEWYFFDGLDKSVQSVEFQNRHYTYNGLYFLPGYVALAPQIAPFVPDILSDLKNAPERPVRPERMASIQRLQKHLHTVIHSKNFLLAMRFLFAAITALVIPWLYLTGRVLFPEGRVPALLGAAFAGLSWEVAYHARFITVDGMLMQFTALTLLFVALFLREPREGRATAWAIAAAAAAGLGMGSKMTGLYLILPVLAAVVLNRAAPLFLTGRKRALLALGALVAFAVTFVLTTPGALYDPVRFIGHMTYELLNYHHLPPDHPYYVDGLGHRLWAVARWLTVAVPSAYGPAALGLSLVAAVGVVAMARERHTAFLVLALFAGVFVWFLALPGAVYVRNALPLVPVMALFFAAGCRSLGGHLAPAGGGGPAWRVWVAATAVALVLLTNGGWLYATAASVAEATRADFIARLRGYMVDKDNRPFWLSPALYQALERIGPTGRVCLQPGAESRPASPAGKGYLALFSRERPFKDWKANRPGFVAKTFGSMAVNYDYAPSWRGNRWNDRIAVLRIDNAPALGVDPKTYVLCRPILRPK